MLTLTIHEVDAGEGLEFSLSGQGIQLQVTEWLLSRDRKTICDLCSQPSPDFSTLTKELGRVLPLQLQQGLAPLEGGALSLLTDSPWPWELAGLASGRLQERFVLNRRGTSQSPALPLEGPAVLALVGTELRPPGKVESLAATAAATALFQGRFGMVHLRLAAIDRTSLQVGSGRLDLADSPDSSRSTFLPSLVFLDLDHPAEAPPAATLAPALSLAGCLWGRGVACVVATAWAGEGQLRAAGMEAFYASLMGGDSVGEALCAFRGAAASSDDRRCTAGSLVVYGDCGLRAEQLVPLEIRPPLAHTTVSGLERASYLLSVCEGPDEGREIPLFARAMASGRPVTLGRSGLRRCDIELDDPELDNLAFRLEMHGDRFHLVNLTGNPGKVRVNGLPVTSGVDLKMGDRLSSGQSSLIIQAPEEEKPAAPQLAEPEQQASGRYILEVLTGVDRDQGGKFSLDAPIALLGRLDECAVRLHDPGVSRRHASIVTRGRDFFLSPVGEARVILNGVPLQKESALAHDDRIQLTSKTLLRFCDQARGGRAG